jgi:hypothetical protein
MALCETCHVTSDWASVARFDHEFSTFPLIGMHELVPCETCHLDDQLGSTDDDCISCHAQDDIHQDSLGDSCNQCHTPNAWDIWRFDHTLQTDYALEGKHEDLSCDSCHLPATDPAATSERCGTCHIEQDIHRGSYGDRCGQCHNTSDFAEVTMMGRRR